MSTRIKNINKGRFRDILGSPWLMFLPFLIVYMVFVMLMREHINDGDSLRYQFYAQNLLHGYFTDRDCVDIWNGPGYPLILVPILFLKLPMIAASFLNAFFQYLSVVFLYKIIKFVSTRAYAVVLALAWACYYPVQYHLYTLTTEATVNLLVVLLCFFTLKATYGENVGRAWRNVVFAGFVLGILALTKVIFGYVIPVLILMAFAAYILLKPYRVNIMRCACITVIGIGVCIPWLAYTYSVTDKPFFWAASGGENLYRMSVNDGTLGTPGPGFIRCKNVDAFNWDAAVRDLSIPAGPMHRKIAETANSLPQIESDAYLKKIAIENIKADPMNYAKNLLANV